MSKSTRITIHNSAGHANLLADAFAEWLAKRGVPIERGDEMMRHEELVQTVFAVLPPVFHALVTRHRYPAFEAGLLRFYANTDDAAEEDNWLTAAFADLHLVPPLLAQGLLPFARPDTGSYDPICFDTRRPLPNGDCPLVQINHEEVLCRNRIGKVREIAPSFALFIENCLAREEVTP